MRELGHRFGGGPAGEPVPEPTGVARVPDAVLRADLRRSRQAVFGAEVHPQAALFASRLAQAVADSPSPVGGESATVPAGHAGAADRGTSPAGPGLRGAVLDGRPVRPAPPDPVPLPTAPALVCDAAGRIVRVNAALVRLAGHDDTTRSALFGIRLPQLVVGPDADARLVRADGSAVRVRAVRWPVPREGLAAELMVVVLVELEAAPPAEPEAGHTVDATWAAELERLARVGTWTFELATSTLNRSETLDELYRSAGVDPDGGGSAPLEGEQIGVLCQALRSGAPAGDHHVELQLPGDRMLSCRAEVECDEDGNPMRVVGVVHDVSADRIAQRRMERSGRRFDDLMAIVPGGIALLDSAGRVVDANGGLCRMLDASPEALRGAPATAMSADEPPDGNGAASLPGWLRFVPPARARYRVDAVPLRRGDGTTVWCELAVSTTSSDDGGWFWLVACHRHLRPQAGG